MADFSKLSPDAGTTILNVKDATARTGVNNAFAVMGENGAKNLLQNNATSKTANEVTWTVNSDKTISVTGTPTGFSNIEWRSPLKPGKYYLNGLKDTTNVGYSINAIYKNGVLQPWTEMQWSDGMKGDNLLDLSSYDFDAINFIVKRWSNNVACTGTIKPMIRLSSDPDSTYQPNAMTNKELTDKVSGIISAATNAADFAAFKTAIAAL